MAKSKTDFTTDDLPRRDGSVAEMLKFLRPDSREQCDPINGKLEKSIELDIDCDTYEKPTKK